MQSHVFSQFYNGMQMVFGRSRIQYEEQFWSFNRYERFETYFYQGGKNLAIYTARFAEAEMPKIEEFIGTPITQKIQFIIYNKLSDLKQSNIGLIADVTYNVGGITNIVGTKVILYFNGDFTDFRQQIRAGIAQILFNQVMYGDDLASMLKNQVLFNLSDWYAKGFVSYMSHTWDTDIDDKVRDGMLYGNYNHLYRLEGEDAVIAGHSVWNYIASRYGETMLPSILYIAKISHNVEASFNYVLGISFKQLMNDWHDYYIWRYSNDTTGRQTLPLRTKLVKSKRDIVLKQVELSPDSSLISYVRYNLDKHKVFIKDTISHKRKRIYKGGFKVDEKVDYSYPIVRWHPSGKLLTIITERKGVLWMYNYFPEEKRVDKQQFFDVEKVLDFNFSDDGRNLVMSAVKNGQSDIFIHDRVSHNNLQITNDVYDDLHPCFIKNSNAILFSSNRTNDTIQPTNLLTIDVAAIPEKKDLFLYNYKSETKILQHITETPLTSELYVQNAGYDQFSFISDKNGISNRFFAKFDSTVSFIDTTIHFRYFTNYNPITNFPLGIKEQHLSSKSNFITEIIHYKSTDQISIVPSNFASGKPVTLQIKNSYYMQQLIDDTEKKKSQTELQKKQEIEKGKNAKPKISRHKHVSLSTAEKQDSVIFTSRKIDINNYIFGDIIEKTYISTEKIKDTLLAEIAEQPVKMEDIPIYLQKIFFVPKQQNLDVEFSINKLVTQMDFAYLGQNYQPYTGGGNSGSPMGFVNPGMNLNFKVGVLDLLEDYRLTGGMALSPNLKNNEYMVSAANLKRRVDKEFIFHRQIMDSWLNLNTNDETHMKYRMHNFYYQLKYPFSPILCVKGTAIYRNNKYIYLSNSKDNLIKKDVFLNWIGAKTELVLDNTKDGGLNILYGTRFKLFGEYNQLVEDKQTNIVILGCDFRKYIKIHRCFIWANRFAASTSFGTYKLLYYMGGVDSWMFPKFSQENNGVPDQKYIYQTLATNMRGFNQNVRSGNSFAVINSELRLPLLRYFSNKPLRSEMLYNLQIIGFADIGSAWTGLNPYSENNSLYRTVIVDPPITVTVINQKEPIVGGFGWGLRTKLLGYFIRADWAWGIEDKVISPRIFYLSFSLDF